MQFGYQKFMNDLKILMFNTLKHFWPRLGQRKTSLDIFMKRENKFSYLFGHNIISNGIYQAIRNNFGQKDN